MFLSLDKWQTKLSLAFYPHIAITISLGYSKGLNYEKLTLNAVQLSLQNLLKILGAVESSLSKLAALIRDFLPVGLTNNKTNRAFSVSILLLFEISPAHLEDQ